MGSTNGKVLSKFKMKNLLIFGLVIFSILIVGIVAATMYMRFGGDKSNKKEDPLSWSVDSWSGTDMSADGYLNDFASRGRDTYTIDSADSFRYFVHMVNNGLYTGNAVYLNTSIDFQGYEIPSIGTSAHPFTGTFDGGYHTLMNLKVNGGALFGATVDASIKNVGVYNITIDSDESYVAGLVSQAVNTDISDSFVRKGILKGGEYVSGLVGKYISYNGERSIYRSFADIDIEGSIKSGIIGDAEIASRQDKLYIDHCYYTNVDNAVSSINDNEAIGYKACIKATALSNFNNKDVWSYSDKYDEELSWCDYTHAENSRELTFNYPILTRFAKVYLKGYYYHNTIKVNGVVENCGSLQDAFELIPDGKGADITLIPENIVEDDYAVIKGNRVARIVSARDVIITRGENNLDGWIVVDGANIILGKERINENTPKITLDGNKNYVEKNQKETGSLIVATNNATLNIKNITIKNNIANKQKIEDEIIPVGVESNDYFSSATAGGAIYGNNSTLNVYNTVFENCEAKTNGGAIFWAGDVNIYSGTEFVDNTAELGGAIYLDNTTSCNLNIIGNPSFMGYSKNGHVDSICIPQLTTATVDNTSCYSLNLIAVDDREYPNKIKLYIQGNVNINAYDRIGNLTFYFDNENESLINGLKNGESLLSVHTTFSTNFKYENLKAKYEYEDNKFEDYYIVSGANITGDNYLNNNLYFNDNAYAVKHSSGHLYNDLQAAIDAEKSGVFYILEDITLTKAISFPSRADYCIAAKNRDVTISWSDSDITPFNLLAGTNLTFGVSVDDAYEVYLNHMGNGEELAPLINLNCEKSQYELFNRPITFTLNAGHINSNATSVVGGNYSKIVVNGGSINSLDSNAPVVMSSSISDVATELVVTGGELNGIAKKPENKPCQGLDVNGNVDIFIAGGSINGTTTENNGEDVKESDIYLRSNYIGTITVESTSQNNCVIDLHQNLIDNYLETDKKLIETIHSGDGFVNANGYVISLDGYLTTGFKTVKFNVVDNNGTVSQSSVVVPINTTFTTNGAVLTFDNGVSVTATANIGFAFDKWSFESGAIVNSCMISIYFAELPLCEVSILTNNDEFGTLSHETVYVRNGTSYTVEDNQIKFADGQVVTASANLKYLFSNWSSTSGIITEETSIIATFILADARIGNKSYESLYTAISKALDGETVYVLKDVILNSRLNIVNNITISADDVDVTIKRSIEMTDYMLYSTAETVTLGTESQNATLTLDGNKLVTATSSILYVSDSVNINENVVLTNNYATTGGAIYADGDETNCVNVTGAVISDCQANTGGAIYVYYPRVEITNSSLIGNIATKGGDIFVRDRSKINITNSSVGEITTYLGAINVIITLNNAKVDRLVLNNIRDTVRVTGTTNYTTELVLSNNIISNKLDETESIVSRLNGENIETVGNKFIANGYLVVSGEDLNIARSSTKYNDNNYYLATPITVNFTSNEYGAVSNDSVQVVKGTSFSTSGNTLTFTDGQSVVANANSETEINKYKFLGWSVATGMIDSPTNINAVFTQEPKLTTVTIEVVGNGSVSIETVDCIIGKTIKVGSQNNKLLIDDEEVTATPNSSTAQYNYSFVGFSYNNTAITTNGVTAVKGGMTIKAEFTSSIRTYDVVWKNYDGRVLETDTNVAYGTVPSYNGAVPTRLESGKIFTFAGWTPSVGGVVGNVEYTATFTSETIVEIPLILSAVVYTGEELEPRFNSLDNFIVGGQSSAIEAGTYTIRLIPKNGFCWADGSKNEVAMDWIIMKRVVNIEIASNPIYNTKTITYYPSNWDDIKDLVTITGNVASLVGDYTATISLIDSHNYHLGVGNAEKTLNWSILALDVNTADISLEYSTTTYTATEKTPAVSLSIGGETISSEDYTVTYVDNVNVGTANINIIGKNNLSGNITKTFDIEKESLDNATITLAYDSVVYTATANTPSVTVKLGEIVVPDTNYTVSYNNNINTGTATVEVVGQSNLKGPKELNFEIIKAEGIITVVNSSLQKNFPELATNMITGNHGGVVTVSSSDEDIATVEINGDTITVTPMTKGSVTITVNCAETDNYNSASTTFDVVFGSGIIEYVVSGDGDISYDALAHGITVSTSIEDIEIRYGSSANECNSLTSPTFTNVGSYTVYFSLTDTNEPSNYTTINKPATINIIARDVASAFITLEYETIEYTGNNNEPSVTVKIGDKIIDESNYTIEYDDNTTVGNATVTIVGRNNLSGSTTKQFSITSATLDTPTDVIWSNLTTASWTPISPVAGLSVSYDVSLYLNSVKQTTINTTDTEYDFADLLESGDYTFAVVAKSDDNVNCGNSAESNESAVNSIAVITIDTNGDIDSSIVSHADNSNVAKITTGYIVKSGLDYDICVEVDEGNEMLDLTIDSTSTKAIIADFETTKTISSNTTIILEYHHARTIVVTSNLEEGEGSVQLNASNNGDTTTAVIDKGNGNYIVGEDASLVVSYELDSGVMKELYGFRYQLGSSSEDNCEILGADVVFTETDIYEYSVDSSYNVSNIALDFYMTKYINMDESIVGSELELIDGEIFKFSSEEGYEIEIDFMAMIANGDTSFKLYASNWTLTVPEARADITEDMIKSLFPDLDDGTMFEFDGIDSYTFTVSVE